ncbi:phytanoyl-CoA dioxygenase family protein [Frankia sp. Ag45/Mut15]|uniref:Phytanoyl-CoA dioxygenase family protein n=1 Tax=Frankia umida TaxID=573489 RepID=A0ABT0K5L4_9ACTN|nr:phytanoyl-CoA dioxygenase family protein [Frankia umida]MCK9879086.1 phytanoyl-CoA dioxygenase family protein [Frankia umida]
MKLPDHQIRSYRDDGYLVVNRLFAPDEVDVLRTAFQHDGGIPGAHRITEKDSTEVRAVYASHRRQPEFARLVRSPRLLGPARQLVTDEVYVYQFKINTKPGFFGEGWSWHQDYAAWRIADYLPAPKLVNVGLFLDDVTEFNGPLLFLPGSHRDGLISSGRRSEATSTQHVDPEDIKLTRTEMAHLVDRHGMRSPKGAAGSVVFFHPELVHGSVANISPFGRRLVLVTYNDVTNEPQPVGKPRDWYLVEPDATSLTMVDEPLLSAGAAR